MVDGKYFITGSGEKFPWWHSVSGDDTVTSGGKSSDTMEAELTNFNFPGGFFEGKTVLDIGAWDGFYSFYAEKNGASKVVAVDAFVALWQSLADTDLSIDDAYQEAHKAAAVYAGGSLPKVSGRTGIEIMRESLGSNISIHYQDVHYLTPDCLGEQFDIVLFLNVLYHLENPFLALRNISRVAKNVLVMKTHLDLTLDNDKPRATFYPTNDLADDVTNWWGPNPKMCIDMLRCCGFPYVYYRVDGDRGIFYAFKHAEHVIPSGYFREDVINRQGAGNEPEDYVIHRTPVEATPPDRIHENTAASVLLMTTEEDQEYLDITLPVLIDYPWVKNITMLKTDYAAAGSADKPIPVAELTSGKVRVFGANCYGGVGGGCWVGEDGETVLNEDQRSAWANSVAAGGFDEIRARNDLVDLGEQVLDPTDYFIMLDPDELILPKMKDELVRGSVVGADKIWISTFTPVSSTMQLSIEPHSGMRKVHNKTMYHPHARIFRRGFHYITNFHIPRDKTKVNHTDHCMLARNSGIRPTLYASDEILHLHIPHVVGLKASTRLGQIDELSLRPFPTELFPQQVLDAILACEQELVRTYED